MLREWRGGSGLSWFEAGDASGPAVVYFHGTETHRQDLPFADAAAPLGVRVLMADRPGYGSSPPYPNGSFADVSAMVLVDLDEQGIDRFAALGWSGGGPHALACASAAPGRVHTVGLLGSWAPMNPPDPGLPVGVRFAMRVAATLPRAAVHLMLMFGRSASAGMTDDVCRVARPWGFDPAELASTVRVVAWHAEDDPQVPIAPWRAIKGVALNAQAGRAHDVSRDLWETALQSVTRY